MTGAAQSNPAGGQRYLTTPANVAAVPGFWGYTSQFGGYGSLSPNTVFKDKTIESIYSSTSGLYDLYLSLSTNIALFPGILSGIIVVDSAGTTRYYARTAASAGAGFISWGNGSNPVYTNATQRPLTILY
jgi:hypothetical protein